MDHQSLPDKQQKGSVLLTTMMIMLVFIFTGLYVMEMAVLEERTVSNEQRSMQVYQTAYGELEAQLEFLVNNPSILNDALSGDQALTVIINPTGCSVTGQVCQTATLRYVGQTSPPAGYSVGKYIGLMYEIDSVATLDSISAQSNQTLSFTYVTPRAGG